MSEHQIQWGDKSSKAPTSLLIVYGDPATYTPEEVEKIKAFSEELTKKHLEKFTLNDWAWNFYWLEKYEDGSWLSKRATHQLGRLFSDSLDSALEWFSFQAEMLPDGYEIQHFQSPLGENGEMVSVKVAYDNPERRWGRKLVAR